MAGDGILQIGATVDKTGVEAGLGGIGADVKTAVESIAIQVEETTTKTRAAWNKLNDDVKAASQSVSAEALKVAEATKAQTAALGDLRRASVLTRDAKLDEAQTTAILAAAQQKAAGAAAAVATAKEEEAAAVAAANEEETLSENFLVAAFQRAARGVSESCAVIQERLVQTAETGQLSAEGIAAGFSGLSSLLGAGIAVGFGAHFIDELAKMNVELDHLSAKTGISITELAGLQQIMKEAGGDFEAVATGLVRMESNTEKLAQGDKALELAYTNLGLKLEDVRAAKPAELLQMIATAMSHEADANIRANAAIQIFGRGGQAAIPVMREQGELLTANAIAAGNLTGVTEESAEAARRWTQDTARLSAEFKSVLMPVMEHAEDAVRVLAGAFEAAAALIVGTLEAIATAIVAVYSPLGRLAVLLKDVLTGNWGAIKNDAEAMRGQFVQTWKDGFEEIKRNWAEVGRTLTSTSSFPLPPRAGSQEEEVDPAALPGKAKKTRAGGAFQADEAELAQMRLNSAESGYKLSLQAEETFWEQKLAKARKGTDEYREIVAKLADLKERGLKTGAAPAAPLGPQTQSLDTTQLDQQVIQGLQAQEKSSQDATKDEIQAYRAGAEEKMRLAEQDYAEVERTTEFEVRMGRMSASQRLDALRQAANEEMQIREERERISAGARHERSEGLRARPAATGAGGAAGSAADREGESAGGARF